MGPTGLRLPNRTKRHGRLKSWNCLIWNKSCYLMVLKIDLPLGFYADGRIKLFRSTKWFATEFKQSICWLVFQWNVLCVSIVYIQLEKWDLQSGRTFLPMCLTFTIRYKYKYCCVLFGKQGLCYYSIFMIWKYYLGNYDYFKSMRLKQSKL